MPEGADRDSGMVKEHYWYDDAAVEAWAAAGFLAFVFGGACWFVPAMCVPIVGFSALVVFLALTIFLTYLTLTFKRRPEAPSSPGDIRTKSGTK